MKKCPYCAEDIQDAAIVCKHCGRDLDAPAVQSPRVAKVRQADWISTTAKWGVGIFFVLVGVGWCNASLAPPPRTVTPAATAPTPTPSRGRIAAEDIKREQSGKLGSRKVSALEKDGTWIVTFHPALPRDDRTVLDGAEYALREFLRVNTSNATWRPVDKFLRVITGSGAFDVLLLKNDNGTVHSMTITKR